MAIFSIKDIEAITGIKAHTLRIWEQRYNLVKPKRTPTNIRCYDDEDLRYILNVSVLNNNGVKISEIAKLSKEKINEKVQVISEKSTHDSSYIKALVSAMFSLDEAAFSNAISSAVDKLGMESAVMDVVFPFLNRVGVLWMTDAVHPAHEHFITGLVKQKLYVAIDRQMGKALRNGKKFLLFLPEGESHELGLLFANYVLRANGHRVAYLGQNTPTGELARVFDFYSPDAVLTALTSAMAEEDVQDFINQLSEQWPHITIALTGGLVINNHNLRLPSNVFIVKNPEDFYSLPGISRQVSAA